MLGFRVTGINYSSSQTACKLLVITVQHIDNLLAEWYPKIDTFVDLQGVKAIRRVSFCDACVQEAISIQNKSTNVTLPKNDPSSGEASEKETTGTGNDKAVSSAFDVINESDLDSINIVLEQDGEILDPFEKFNTGQDDVNLDDFDLTNEEKELMYEHRQLGKGKLIAFELEEASKLLRENRPLLCPFHLKLDAKNVFPDLVSHSNQQER